MNQVINLEVNVPENIEYKLSEFERFGFVSVPATNIERLITVRKIICRTAGELLNIPVKNDVDFLNLFHKQDLKGNELNTFRTQLISQINANIDIGATIYHAFEEFLTALVGADIAVQKSTNLVIQQPDDIGVSPTHRDAPPNSMYEIVAWVPLVDCYASKGMTILDKNNTEKGINLLLDDDNNNNELEKLARTKGKKTDICFGSAIFFWSALLHSVPVNTEDETRWSLNLRYKNLYSPYGGKGLADYYRILKLSPLSQLAINREKRKLENNQF